MKKPEKSWNYQKIMKIKYFSVEEKERVAYLYEKDSLSLKEIRKIFKCTEYLIKNTLIIFFGKEKYQKIAKEHLRENIRRVNKLPKTQKQMETCRRNGQKVGKLLKTPTQIEASRATAQRVNKLPKTQKQMETCRRNGQLIAHLPRTPLQIEIARKNVQKLHKLPRTSLQIKTSQKNAQKLVGWNMVQKNSKYI